MTASMGKVFSVYFFIVLFGIIGDLFFSYVKRCAGTKDFPMLMTSQGGIIDILDSFLIASIANFLISFSSTTIPLFNLTKWSQRSKYLSSWEITNTVFPIVLNNTRAHYKNIYKTEDPDLR